MAKIWNPGEKAKLDKNGPEMKVKMHCAAGNEPGFDNRPERVICQWFDADGHLHEEEFPPESLEPA